MDYSKNLPYHNKDFSEYIPNNWNYNQKSQNEAEFESASFYFNHFGGYFTNTNSYNDMVLYPKKPIKIEPATKEELADLESEAEELL